MEINQNVPLWLVPFNHVIHWSYSLIDFTLYGFVHYFYGMIINFVILYHVATNFVELLILEWITSF